jgi:hypothetical protein
MVGFSFNFCFNKYSMFPDPPGKVEKPELVDWDKDHVDLKWNPPADDGGAAIEEYIVEVKDKHGKWEEALVVKGGATACTVPNLKEGEAYQFRIIAKNKAGKGPASDPSDSVVCKTRFCKFK